VGGSTYELVQYMKESNLRAIWSRAESQVYKEPKRLEQEGLAESSVEFQGERKRTLYRATRAGGGQHRASMVCDPIVRRVSRIRTLAVAAVVPGGRRCGNKQKKDEKGSHRLDLRQGAWHRRGTTSRDLADRTPNASSLILL